jgi:signal transduction histidine kinase
VSDSSSSLVLWTFAVSAGSVALLLGVTAGVFAWYQRRVAEDARQWGRHLLEAQDAERQRIARELHDDMVPRLYAASLAVERSDGIAATADLAGVMGDLRSMAHELHPPALKHLDICQALSDLLERHASPDGPALSLQTACRNPLPPPLATALYRVAQEGVTNARRHAAARQVAIALTDTGEAVRLSVRDDGIGIAPERLARASFGLRSMRERIEALGGTLEVEGRSGQGTEVRAVVPHR